MSEENTSEPNVITPGSKVKDIRRVAVEKELAEISGKNTKSNDKIICVASEILNITIMVGVLLIYKYVL